MPTPQPNPVAAANVTTAAKTLTIQEQIDLAIAKAKATAADNLAKAQAAVKKIQEDNAKRLAALPEYVPPPTPSLAVVTDPTQPPPCNNDKVGIAPGELMFLYEV
jgi:hypothetical protein